MNVLATFESATLHFGLTRYDDHDTVKVAITLVLQWMLSAVHHRYTSEQCLDNVHQVIQDTYPHAEFMLGGTSVVDHKTGKPVFPSYPTIHQEPDKNYSFGEYSTAYSGLYCRYSEIVEHIVRNYARQVMGFLQTLEHDKHATTIQCLEYTDRYIAVIIHCRNLIEYEHPTAGNESQAL